MRAEKGRTYEANVCNWLWQFEGDLMHFKSPLLGYYPMPDANTKVPRWLPKALKELSKDRDTWRELLQQNKWIFLKVLEESLSGRLKERWKGFDIGPLAEVMMNTESIKEAILSGKVTHDLVVNALLKLFGYDCFCQFVDGGSLRLRDLLEGDDFRSLVRKVGSIDFPSFESMRTLGDSLLQRTREICERLGYKGHSPYSRMGAGVSPREGTRVKLLLSKREVKVRERGLGKSGAKSRGGV